MPILNVEGDILENIETELVQHELFLFEANLARLLPKLNQLLQITETDYNNMSKDSFVLFL